MALRMKKYTQNCDKGKLPLEERFRHVISWPVQLEKATFALGNVHEENYTTPSGSIEYHTGIDLHCFSGTPVFAPENSYLLLALQDNRPAKQKVDLYLQGQKTKIIYSFCHLDFESLPKKIKEVNGRGEYRYFQIIDGELLGAVGKWHQCMTNYPNYDNQLVKLFGNRCDHLHISTSLPAEEDFKKQRIFSWTDEFNPLLILKRLE